MSGAHKLLIRAEFKDGYRKKCKESPVNDAARKGHHYTPFFVPEEHLKRLQFEIFKIELLNGADILVLHSSADNGYPHTRPESLVCLPESFVANSSNETLAETLRHEAMHIHQRKFPDLWKQKCLDEGWAIVDPNSVPQRFRNQCRINPDTMDIPFWSWDTYHIPLPIFKDDNPQGLGDVRIEWLDSRTAALFHEPPPSFTEKYGNPSQPEHPYEIYAVIYASQNISSHAALYNKLVSK